MYLTKMLARISILFHSTQAFLCSQNRCKISTALSALPTISQLSSDPFMKQVTYASQIIPLLEKDEDVASDLLQAQLTHSDGIRGFFVSYLTNNDGVADGNEVPKPLVEAMKNIDDQSDLVKLAIMNVIMPTAMSTMHTDPELQNNSLMTAERAIKVLQVLKEHPEATKHCIIIHKLASSQFSLEENNVDEYDPLATYWFKFMENYGYEEQQRQDIATTIQRFV